MKNYLFILLTIFPLVLYGQEKEQAKFEKYIGIKTWTVNESYSLFKVLNDSTFNYIESDSRRLSSLNPYVQFKSEKGSIWQFGISELVIKKERYNDWFQKVNTERSDTAFQYKHEYFHFGFESFAVKKITTKSKYLPSLFIQANLRIAQNNLNPLISEQAKFNEFLISSMFLTGFEYDVKISAEIALNLGLQLPIYGANFSSTKNFNPSISANQRRSSLFSLDGPSNSLPNLRFGLAYKL